MELNQNSAIDTIVTKKEVDLDVNTNLFLEPQNNK